MWCSSKRLLGFDRTGYTTVATDTVTAAGFTQSHTVRASPPESHSIPAAPSHVKIPRQPPSTHIWVVPAVQPNVPADRRRLELESLPVFWQALLLIKDVSSTLHWPGEGGEGGGGEGGKGGEGGEGGEGGIGGEGDAALSTTNKVSCEPILRP